MATIGIILLNYNSTRLTKKCVKSLLTARHETDTYKIVIYDNDSKIKPKPADFPDCELVLSEKNRGFAEGNNRAVEYLLRKNTCDYLLLLNNDTRVGKGCIRALIERFESDPDIGMVVPKIYFEKGYEYHATSYSKHQLGRVLWYAGGGIDWRNMILFHKGVDEVDRGQFDTDVQTEAFATGCCLLTSVTLWKKLRGFDPRYFLYYEDADLSLRLLNKLHKSIVLEPRAVLYHLNAGSSDGSGSAVHQYYQTRNRLRFGFSYASRRTQFALLLEARRLFLTGNGAVKLGILDALGGKWGNQTWRIPVEKQSVPSSSAKTKKK